MGTKLDRLKKNGVIDPDAADALKPDVVKKVEELSDAEIDAIIKFKLNISGTDPWDPEEDGAIF